MRFALVVIAATTLVVGASACGGSSEGDAAGTPTPMSARDALVGTWVRNTTCAELVQALGDAGLAKFAAEFVVGNGFVPGVRSTAELDDRSRLCKEAVARKHSHFFTADGAFGSRDWNDESVDDGTYRVDGAGTLVISKEFPDVTFRYRIEGDTITFDPVIPNGCATFRCAWSVSMAYPGKAWRRVQ